MPRRPGWGSAEDGFVAVDAPAAAPTVRETLASCIAGGVLKDSVSPCWSGKGSRFQLLEWIGDSVLQIYLTQQIHDLYAGAGCGEGQMSAVRSLCEGTNCLSKVFRMMSLAKLLREKDPATAPNYLISDKKCADVVEAILGELFEVSKTGCSQAPVALAALLELIFHVGLQESPQRLRPSAVQVSLLCLVPGPPVLHDPGLEGLGTCISGKVGEEEQAREAEVHRQTDKDTDYWYLPMSINGVQVLVSEGDRHYRADNSQHQANTAGLRYRASQTVDDLVPSGEAYLRWNGSVEVVEEGRDWVKVHTSVACSASQHLQSESGVQHSAPACVSDGQTPNHAATTDVRVEDARSPEAKLGHAARVAIPSIPVQDALSLEADLAHAAQVPIPSSDSEDEC